MKKSWAILVLLASFIHLPAQKQDSAYIRAYPNKLLVSPFFRYQYSRRALEINQQPVLEVENQTANAGVRAALGKFVLGGSIPVVSSYPASLEQTKYLGASAEFMTGYGILQLGAGYRRGFSISDGNQTSFHPELKRAELKFGAIYPLNYRRFSMRAQLRMVDQQIRSSSSVLIAFGAERQFFWGPEQIVFPDLNQLTFRTYANWELLPGLGYGVSLIHRQWNFSLLGVAYGKFYRVRFDEQPWRTHLAFSPHGRAVLGYHSPGWFVCVTGLYDRELGRPQDLFHHFSRVSIFLILGKRIDPPRKVYKTVKKIEGLLE